jgi:hypothetical protein
MANSLGFAPSKPTSYSKMELYRLSAVPLEVRFMSKVHFPAKQALDDRVDVRWKARGTGTP